MVEMSFRYENLAVIIRLLLQLLKLLPSHYPFHIGSMTISISEDRSEAKFSQSEEADITSQRHEDK